MREVTCLLCGTNAYARLLYPANITEVDLSPTVFSARRIPDKLHGNVYRCLQCSLVYTNPQLDWSRLSELYHVSTYTYGEEENYIRKTYRRYLKKLLDVLQKPKTKNQKLQTTTSYLDIGCGNGFMLLAAKEIGIEDVWGVEPSRHAIAHADPQIRDHIIQGMFSLDVLEGKRFDAISCFQTLDHIPDPKAFVEDCFQALKAGGVALFINHNIGSLLARLLGERCPMIDIEHTFLHTPQTMQQLFRRCGFSSVRTFAVRNDYPLHYWIYLCPGPKFLKRPLLRRLKESAIGSIILPLYAGNLGLIARKDPFPLSS